VSVAAGQPWASPAAVNVATTSLSQIFETPQARSAKLPRLTSPGRAAQA
jgi:hypothetical protein